MRRKLLILAALVALAQLPFASSSVFAQHVGVGIEVGVAPPPMRVEAVPPPPGAAFAWVRGHWQWNGAQWVWRPGHYARRPTPAAYWVEGGWIQMPNGHWRWRQGHWHR